MARPAASEGADLVLLAPEPPGALQRWVGGGLLDRLVAAVRVPITVLTGPTRQRQASTRAPRRAA